nr:ALA-interacting subunit 3-like [Ipomoea batatas]
MIAFLCHGNVFFIDDFVVFVLFCDSDSRFTQQELPACKPILTPAWVIATFISIGFVFVPIGLVALSASQRVVEIVDRYDDLCIPSSKTDESDSNLERAAFVQSDKTNKVPKKMQSPVFIYYELENFYQNHRRYVKSRSDKQLRSPDAEADTKTCAPEDLNNNKPIVPCGLVAWSLFNDSYGFKISNKDVPVNRKDIAWTSDKTHKFGADVYPKNFQQGGLIGGGKLNESLPLSEQEDLLVWMRTAALPNFRKLYGRIESDLEANQQITVVIQNNYNTYTFGGKKKLVISTATWIGGKNDFLGVAYLTIGGICLFLAISFILLYVIKPRSFGDPAFLSWNRNPDMI